MQAKKPATPYAPKPDGSSYCQLVGGTWHGLWFRFYPKPRWFKDEPGGIAHEMDESLSVGAEVYERCALSEHDPKFAAWRQVQYRLTSEELI